ncbi:MAG: hypothetical protein HY543_01115 [Deltaproteobacteria bacterium]|nr:hypothetical protein [Deltaproteobacteria bacterium]
MAIEKFCARRWAAIPLQPESIGLETYLGPKNFDPTMIQNQMVAYTTNARANISIPISASPSSVALIVGVLPENFSKPAEMWRAHKHKDKHAYVG